MLIFLFLALEEGKITKFKTNHWSTGPEVGYVPSLYHSLGYVKSLPRQSLNWNHGNSICSPKIAIFSAGKGKKSPITPPGPWVMPFKMHERKANTVSLDALTRHSGNPSIGAIELRGLPENHYF
jgi:hypothetical protein